jgi:hypothetical protein
MLILRVKHRFSRFYQSKLLIDEFGHILSCRKVSKCSCKGILPPMVNPLQFNHVCFCNSNLEKNWVIFLEIIKFNDPIKSAQSATTFRFFDLIQSFPPKPERVSLLPVFVYFSFYAEFQYLKCNHLRLFWILSKCSF